MANRKVLSFVAASFLMTSVAAAQTTDTGSVDVNQLLEQFGPLLGLNDVTSGITTTPDGTGTTTTQPAPTPGDGTGPQPTIVENQFTTTSGGALQARAPGLMVQRALAVQTGEVTLEGNATSEPGWVGQTLEDIGMAVIETISGIVTSISGLFDFSDIFDPGSGGGSGGGNQLPNGATTGGGTTTPIQ